MSHITEVTTALQNTIEGEKGKRIECPPAPYTTIDCQYHSDKNTLTLRMTIPKENIEMDYTNIRTVDDGHTIPSATSIYAILSGSPYIDALLESIQQATQLNEPAIEQSFEKSYCFQLDEKHASIIFKIPLKQAK